MFEFDNYGLSNLLNNTNSNVGTTVSSNYINKLGDLYQNTNPLGSLFGTQLSNNNSDGFGSMFKEIGGLKGLGSLVAGLGSIYGAIAGNSLGRDSLNFQKQAYNTNLRNQEQAYNTNLTDRITSRNAFEGKSAADTQAYINQNKL